MKTVLGVVMASLLALSAGVALSGCGEKKQADSCDAILEKMVSFMPEEFQGEMKEELANMSDEEKAETCGEMTEEQRKCILEADESAGPEALAECELAGAAE